jgi:hypothetical protein
MRTEASDLPQNSFYVNCPVGCKPKTFMTALLDELQLCLSILLAFS